MKKIILGLLSFFSFIGIVSANGSGCFTGGMMMGSYGSGMMFFGWIFSLLVIIALVLLIIWLIKQIQKK